MRLLTTFLAFFFFLGINALQAQTSKDATVPITATLNTGPTSITLNWANPGNTDLLILRRTKGQAGNAWVLAFNATGSNLNSITDIGVANGQIYEYVIQRILKTVSDTIVAFGYAHVAINANPVNSRGKVLIFVDSTTADATGAELVRLKNDMRGDGWWPIAFHTGPSSTVQSVKNQIIASYNADPLNVKAVLLIGTVPIPYSGNANWDGHPEHAGAWPSDAYYADVNGTWTDVSENNVTPARAANVNIPGDGKFDQSVMPTAAELQVGRIDFRRLDAPAFGAADHAALVKRYLEKNHRWRTGQYVVSNKALVDDNFGYFGGEAFAADGYRNAYPLVGEANVVTADFFNDTDAQSFLLGYGAGGGWYTSASGVGSSANFATDSVNIVFSNLFGSYFGDWDYETNPFMPSALASRGGILTCSWAGRPHWFNQAFASGETIGYCTWETMNTQFNNGFFGSAGESGAHVALLGDPTLRAHVVKPATNLTAAAMGCNGVVLNWTASPDAVTGYHIYRALSQDGPYLRLTVSPITATTYTDNAPILDTLYYQARAIQNVSTPGGGTYANNAVGPIQSFVFTGLGGPVVTATGGTQTCTSFNVMLTAAADPASVTSWSWAGPNNFSSGLQNPTVMNAGTYTVTATDATGCIGTATAVVAGDFAAPTIVATVSNALTCVNPSATITVDSTGLSSCVISGPGVFVQGCAATVTQPGAYTITATSSTNGCLGNSMVSVVSNSIPPSVAASNSGPITCVNLSSQLTGTTNAPNATFTWSGPCVSGTTATCPGTYTVTVMNPANGCTNTATTAVLQDVALPSVTIQPPATLTCAVTSVPLVAIPVPANSTQQWTGPCLSMGNPPMATCPGTYTVVVTNTANGCIQTASVSVAQNIVPPSVNLPPLPPLTCAAPCAVLTVPNIPGIQFLVAGQVLPPGFSITICDPSTIVIQARSLANGCSTDVELLLTQDMNVPTASAGPDKFLSCNAPTVQLDGSGSSAGAMFTVLWTGPDGFMSSQISPTVNATGAYTILVTNTENGCTASDIVQVTADGSLPTVNATVSGPLNCSNQTVQLQSGNNDPGATFNWSPSAGLSCSNCPNPTASQPGIYMVVVTVGTCTATDMVEVTKALDLVVTSDPVVLNCDGVITSCVNVSGGTPPYSILWSNGSTTNCATYTGTSTIGVMVSDAGGCSFQSTQTVVVSPPLDVVITSAANCTGPITVCAMPAGGTPPYAYQWSNGTNANCTTLSGGGMLGLTVTDARGCTKSANAVITQPPAIVLTTAVTHESAPNANNGAINLTVVSGGVGQVFVYAWSNGAQTQDLAGLAGGTYTVTVTDATTGCTQTASATVLTTVGTEEAVLFAQFLLSPNPTEGLALLSLKLHEAAALRVEIRDVAGRLVWENPVLETDALNLPIDLTQSPAGMYTVSVWVGTQVFVRKLAIAR